MLQISSFVRKHLAGLSNILFPGVYMESQREFSSYSLQSIISGSPNQGASAYMDSIV